MKKHLFTAAFASVLITFAGCTTTRKVYVPIENTNLQTRTDTVRLKQLRTDTIRERDSVAMIQRGDTVFLSRTLWRERVRERRDTIYVAVRDTLRVTRTEPVVVQRELTTWQDIKLKAGGAALALLGMLLALSAVRLVRRLRR